MKNWDMRVYTYKPGTSITLYASSQTHTYRVNWANCTADQFATFVQEENLSVQLTCYYLEGYMFHRLDGPAYEETDGHKFWCVEGRHYSETEYKDLSFQRADGIYVDWEGEFHRNDGPASISSEGSTYWYKHGGLHRIGAPAIEHPDGHREWWVDGKPHRVDGPAVELPDQYEEWWLNGLLHRTDGPAIKGKSGIQRWYQNGKLHREDGPAIEGINGYKEWWIDGSRLSTDSNQYVKLISKAIMFVLTECFENLIADVEGADHHDEYVEIKAPVAQMVPVCS